jgi:hypothetical protein
MKYSTFEDVMASFPRPVLPAVQGEPDYQTIHATRNFLQANSRAIYTHLDGGTLGHLGLIGSDASYAQISPTTNEEQTLWVTPPAPGRAPAATDGTAAQISAAHYIWEEDVQTYRTYTSVQQALKKQIISVFEPMYLDILNDNMVGYTSISARDMLDRLFETYGNITTVDLEINFEHMRRAWYPQQPVASLFKQIQDCADYLEAWGRPHRSPATDQRSVCKNLFNRPLHERMSPVERKSNHGKNLDTLQIAFRRSSSSTQANAVRIRSNSRLPLSKCRRDSK